MTGGKQGGEVVNHEKKDNDINKNLTDDSEDEFIFESKFCLIHRDDPKAYSFNI